MIVQVVSSNADLPLYHQHRHLHLHQQRQRQRQQPPSQHMMLGDSSGDDAHEVKAPKKRAETWVQDETRSLIGFRREMDGLFNTTKSNKHLWEKISAKMRDKGFDRSPTMCTDKWRNLLKEFKKAKHQERRVGTGGSAKMSCCKEIDEILRERSKNAHYKSPTLHTASKVDSFMQFADQGFEDNSMSFGPLERMLLLLNSKHCSLSCHEEAKDVCTLPVHVLGKRKFAMNNKY